MAFSTQRAVSDGTMAYLDVSIQYIKRADIGVFYNGLPANPATWAWVGTTDKRIAFTPNVPNGVEVLLKRTTQIDTIINVFSAGAKFNNATMDLDFTQLLYLNQEAVEGAALTDIFNDVDFHGYKIKNLGLAVDDNDAITFGQLKSMSTGAYNAQIAAEAARDLAQKWASQLTTTVDGTSYSAKQYALNASGSASAAAGSASAASGSASAASSSQGAAAASASAASGSASAASTSQGAAAGSQSAAATSAQLAQDWAAKPTGTVDGTSKSAKQYAADAASSAGANVGKYDIPLEIYRGAGTGKLLLREGTVAVPGSTRWELDHNSGTNGDFQIQRSDSAGAVQDQPFKILAADGKTYISKGLDVGSKVITSVADPVATTDAANKAYVDTFMPKAGGTFTGDVSMGTKALTVLNIKATRTTAPASGELGQFVDSGFAGPTAWSNNVAADLALLNLPAGVWDVEGYCICSVAAAIITNYAVGIAQSANTLAAGQYTQITGTTASGHALATPRVRFVLTTTTTIHLVVYTGYNAGGTPTVQGKIKAWLAA